MNFYPSFNNSDFINFDLIQYYENMLSELVDDKLFSYKNNDYYETLKFIDKSLENNPSNSILYAFKGFVLSKLDYIDDALICCDISLNLDDMVDFNWLVKSIILKKLNRNIESLLCYKDYVFLRFGEDLNLKDLDLDKKPINFEIELNYDFKDYYSNNYQTFNELFNQNNLDFINHNNLTLSQYKDILNKIKKRSNEILDNTINKYFVDLDSLELVDKIILYVKVFSEVYYKSEGSESGSYLIDEITLDDRLYKSAQIFTLIHELSHDLIREIFDQTLMRMLNCSKTDLLSYFISFTLENREYKLMDEYCANKVQSRFMPLGYQEFDSYAEIVEEEFDFYNEKDIVKLYSQLGKSFSHDVLFIIEDYIDDAMREDIKNQFNLDPHESPTYKIEMEDLEDLNEDEKINILNSIIKDNFENVLINPTDFKTIYEGNIR